jgi:hypothetical protein
VTVAGVAPACFAAGEAESPSPSWVIAVMSPVIAAMKVAAAVIRPGPLVRNVLNRLSPAIPR